MSVKGPLKRITAETYPEELRREDGSIITTVYLNLLECGHTLRQAQDIYGVRYPERRRCWKCRDGLAVDVDVTSLDGEASRGA